MKCDVVKKVKGEVVWYDVGLLYYIFSLYIYILCGGGEREK